MAEAGRGLATAQVTTALNTVATVSIPAFTGGSTLASNGGLTPTMAVGISSPVVDKGVSGGLTTDQRGLARPVDVPAVANAGDGSDIGAYEVPVPAESQVWVANRSANRITRYAAGATGNAAPVATIEGAATGLSAPTGVAVDGAGRLYVANETANSVTAYAPSANGNAGPLYSISGASTGHPAPGPWWSTPPGGCMWPTPRPTR